MSMYSCKKIKNKRKIILCVFIWSYADVQADMGFCFFAYGQNVNFLPTHLNYLVIFFYLRNSRKAKKRIP